MIQQRGSLRRRIVSSAVAVFAALTLVACGSGEGTRNLAVHDEGDDGPVVNFFSPMEKVSPDAENTARTASDQTIAMAEQALGLTVAYRTYTAEDYQDKTYDEVCLDRVRSARDDLYLLNSDVIVALGSEGKLADLSGLSSAQNLREEVRVSNTVDGKIGRAHV